MGVPALTRHSFVPSYTVGLYNPPTEQPKNKSVKELVESPSPDSYIDEPFGGWQAFKKPLYERNGYYLIEINSGYKDLSALNDNNKFERFRYELNSLGSSPKIKHLIINFIHCNNNNPDRNRIYEIAEFLMEKREFYIKSGKMISLAHLEGYLYRDTDLKSLSHFVHENVEDALRNGKNHNELPLQEKPTLSKPYLRVVKPDKDPANITDIPGNYYG